MRARRVRDPEATGSEGKVVWVDPKTVRPGPIQHETLTDEQMAHIRRLQQTFADVDHSSLETWVDNFKRDFHIERELEVWDHIAAAYTRYVTAHPSLSAEQKDDVYRVVLLRSMAPEEEVLPHLELKALTKDEAMEVMRGFGSAGADGEGQ